MFEASLKYQVGVTNISTLESTSTSYLVAPLSPSQNYEFEQRNMLEDWLLSLMSTLVMGFGAQD
jgi:hypothetical protein